MNARAWRLTALLDGIAAVTAADDVEVRGLTQDSRTAAAGDVFVALRGARDGTDYVADAVARGAAAVLCERGSRLAAPVPVSVPVVEVDDLRAQLGRIADRFFDSPSQRLAVIGVTGTNGKTTTTQLLAQVLDAPDARCGIIGTLGSGFPGNLRAGSHTTPDVISVHRLLAELADAGARYVSMEVSSHALVQGRVDGVAFDVAVLTNLTRDHLDYHGDMAAYAAAKARLFESPGLLAGVINADDAFGAELAQRLRRRLKIVSYGRGTADVQATAVAARPTGLRMHVLAAAGEFDLDTQLLGGFNAENVLAVIAVLHTIGHDAPEFLARLAQARAPAGRMECYGGDPKPLVVIDYAHTPDALEKVLHALREHTRKELWCVFGCGGNRDRGKRPLMGGIAERLADRVIVTDDNPRRESPADIVADIVGGMQTRPEIIRDRAAAIRHAVASAQRDDVVLVAGKGHEDYQEIDGQRLPFSDRDAVRAALGLAA